MHNIYFIIWTNKNTSPHNSFPPLLYFAGVPCSEALPLSESHQGWSHPTLTCDTCLWSAYKRSLLGLFTLSVWASRQVMAETKQGKNRAYYQVHWLWYSMDYGIIQNMSSHMVSWSCSTMLHCRRVGKLLCLYDYGQIHWVAAVIRIHTFTYTARMCVLDHGLKEQITVE